MSSDQYRDRSWGNVVASTQTSNRKKAQERSERGSGSSSSCACKLRSVAGLDQLIENPAVFTGNGETGPSEKKRGNGRGRR
ncbi:hypothetical protein J6590_003006 [Homalodisca vitripennis]|nr:hypothetical protein J6590_003006 [Homalodisca vitripennis]